MKRWLRKATGGVDSEVREELQSHLDLRMEENRAHGMAPAKAESEARERFGAFESAVASSARIRRRQFLVRRVLAADLRQAWVGLLRSRVLSLAAVVVTTTGLTTAFATALLSDSLLLRPPHGIDRPDSLAGVLDSSSGRPVMMSIATFRAIEAAAPDVTPFAWGRRDVQVSVAGRGRVWEAALITGNYFGGMKLQAVFGRLIAPYDVAERRQIAVVSQRLVRTIDLSGAGLIGRGILVNGIAFEIVGVATDGFHGLDPGSPVDLWLPISTEPSISTPTTFPDGRQIKGFLDTPGIWWLRGAARLPEGQTLPVLAERLTSAVVATFPNRQGRPLFTHPEAWRPPFADAERIVAVLRPAGYVVFVCLLLTSACLGSLFAGRVASRDREFAVRRAIGAGNTSLVRLIALELSMVVAAATALAALLAGPLLGAAGALQLSPGVTLADAVPVLDARALAMLVAFAGLTFAIALIPPLTMVVRVGRQIRPEAATVAPAGLRFRRWLMVAQTATGCGLLSVSALLTASIRSLEARPLGFDAVNVAFIRLDPAGAGLSVEEQAGLVERLLQLDVGGAQVALAEEPPFDASMTFIIAADGSENARPMATPISRIAGPFFDVLGVAVTAGRSFGPEDAGAPVAIVSQPFADAHWRRQSPIGRTIRLDDAKKTSYRVVGVVPGLRDLTLRADLTSRVYLPLASTQADSITVLARSSGEIAPALVDEAQRLDSRLVAIRAGTLSQLARRTIQQRRLLRALSTVFGVGSLLMIAAGVWGLAHGSLRQRWREFGIRKALGASPGAIVTLALDDARFVVTRGGVLGGLAGWQLGQVFRSWLFNVAPHDALSLALPVIIVSAAALAGCLAPLRQALEVDPARLLRAE